MQKKFRLVLIVYAFLHIGTIILTPNPHSILSRELGPYYGFYTNTIGLNTTWQFFSPDPSQYMYFPYEIQVSEGEPVSGRWPPDPKDVPNMILENYRRLVYHSLYTTISEERTEKFLVPFLCKHAEKPISVSISTVIESVPPLESARIDGLSFNELRQNHNTVEKEYPCPN